METVKLPKGTVVKVKVVTCELTEDAKVQSATIAGMGLEAFLRWSEEAMVSPFDDWPELVDD